jgi:polar amino acid transport system substrate-binding protein
LSSHSALASEVVFEGTDSQAECPEIKDNSILKAAWELNEPYHYLPSNTIMNEPIGLDIELLKLYSKDSKVEIVYSSIPWSKQLDNLKQGDIDLALDISFSDERAKYFHYSIPYRFEEYSFFTLKNSTYLKFINLNDFLMSIRIKGHKFGVVEGVVYADPAINAFFSDPMNKEDIVSYKSSDAALEGLVKGEINGFIDDQQAARALMLKHNYFDKIDEIDLKVKAPVHIAFSKKTVSVDSVEKFNNIIKQQQGTADYNAIFKKYIYPVNFIKVLHSKWFTILSHLGIICFAITGVIIAARYNTNLLGAIIFTFLPAVGGGIIRDIIINIDRPSILSLPIYFYYIIFIALLGFILLRFIEYRSDEEHFHNELIDKIFIFCDAIGQAVFIVFGVAAAFLNNVGPLELWGPFFAFLSCHGGGMVRDAFIKDKENVTNNPILNAEVSIIWAVLLALFLNSLNVGMDVDQISLGIAGTVIGAFLTALAFEYFKVPNIRFYK